MDQSDLSPSLVPSTQTFNLPTVGTVITSGVTGSTYVIEEQIGEGGFGIVYQRKDVWNNNLVAKILKPRVGLENALEQIAADELGKLLHVRHPNITHIFDAFSWNGACYLISERCNQTLSNMMIRPHFRGRLWIMPIARCLLQAVHFAHVQKIVHCDIHAGNVLMRFIPDEMLPNDHNAITFKLGDFRLSKVFGALDPNGIFLDHIRPPEAINPAEFGPLDHRVDIYHVGLLLLQLLIGSRQFSREEVLSGVPRQLALTLEPPYSFALEKALRRHVIYRTNLALELWRDLNSPAS
jgi:serine/threonine protein kinase